MARYQIRIHNGTSWTDVATVYEAEVVDTRRHEVIWKGRSRIRDEAERMVWERSAAERRKRGD